MVNKKINSTSVSPEKYIGTRPKVLQKPPKMGSTSKHEVESISRHLSFYNEPRHCEKTRRPISLEENSMDLWSKQQFDSPSKDIPIETTIISTASLVLSQFPEHPTRYPRSNSSDAPLSDYENSTPPTPPQGLLSKSSSTSSTSSLMIRPFTRSAHFLSSTSLSSVNFPMFQPIEFPRNSNYSFHTSDCEDHSDYVPLNFTRSFHHGPSTTSPLISRPSSPLPPTPSPNFSRSPSPNRSSRRFPMTFSPGSTTPNSAPGTPLYSTSLNPSRESSPLRLRPSSYTRPLSPNPPTISPGPSRGQSPRNLHSGSHQQSSSRQMRSVPSSPQSQPRSPFYHQAVLPTSNSSSNTTLGMQVRSSTPSLGSPNRTLSLRSPPSPTRVIIAPSHRDGSPGHTPFGSRSPVTSRPPSPLNIAARHHSLLLPCARPARSRSQPPGSHRLHSRAR